MHFGKYIMAIYSLAMIGLSVYSVVYDKKIDSSVATMYSAAIVAYAASKTYKETKTPVPAAIVTIGGTGA
jgi:uncharacterized membrane protein (UPF0136 family)